MDYVAASVDPGSPPAPTGDSQGFLRQTGPEQTAQQCDQWTFWLDKSVQGSTASEFEATVRKICTISSVQEFWNVYTNIPDVSELCMRCSYHLMRGERRPVWEDVANCRGGSWKFRCAKEEASSAWQELLLAALREDFQSCLAPGDEVIGVSISTQENDDVIHIWNSNSRLAPRATVVLKARMLIPSLMSRNSNYKAFVEHSGFKREHREEHKEQSLPRYPPDFTDAAACFPLESITADLKEGDVAVIDFDTSAASRGMAGDDDAMFRQRDRQSGTDTINDDGPDAMIPLPMAIPRYLPKHPVPKWLLPRHVHPLNNPHLQRNRHPLPWRRKLVMQPRDGKPAFSLFPPFLHGQS